MKMAEYIKATGNIMICLGKDIMSGLTVENMKTSTKTIFTTAKAELKYKF